MRLHNRVACPTSEYENEVLQRFKYNVMGPYSWLEGMHNVTPIMSTREMVFMAYAASHMPIVRFHPYYDDEGEMRLTVYVEDEEATMFTPATPSNLETLYLAHLYHGRIGKARRMRRLAQRRRLNNIPALAENNFSVKVIFDGGCEYTYTYDVTRGSCEVKRA